MKLPDFTAKDYHGQTVTLRDLLARAPVVLVMLRGLG